MTPTHKTYVLDTSVLLSDPGSIGQFDEHDVIIPIAVVTELEAKRSHPDLGWAARTVLRRLEDLRVKHGSILTANPINDLGGTVRVEMNHQDRSNIPDALRGDNNDFRILVVAHNLATEGHDVTLVSKDLPLRLRASVIGLGADEYRHEQHPAADPWSGIERLEVHGEIIDRLYTDNTINPVDVDAANLAVNTGVILKAGSQSVIGRVRADGRIHRIPDTQTVFDLKPRSAEQRIALDMLLDDQVGVVSLSGPAGTGKSVMALAAALEAVLEQRTYRKVMVFRPTYAVGGEDLGFLPGTLEEKMAPWGLAVQDALESLTTQPVIDEITARGLLEVCPVTHIRGRTLGPDVLLILEESQNWEQSIMLGLLSRLGERSRVFMNWDPDQRDNLRVGRYEGVVSMAARLRGHPLFGHVTLARQERSAIAEMASTLLAPTN